MSPSAGLVIEHLPQRRSSSWCELQPGRSKLRRGDRLLRVNGAPVSQLQEVAWQLRDLQPDAKIVLELVRRGRLRTVTLTMPKLGDEAAPRSESLEVAPPGPKVQRWRRPR